MIGILNIGLGNIESIKRCLLELGVHPIIVSDSLSISKCSHLIMPGVGEFDSVVSAFHEKDMWNPMVDFLNDPNRRFLGICIGMQILFDQSDEHGKHAGLGFIPGRVVKIPQDKSCTVKRKIPHIGWSALQYPEHRQNWENSVLESTNEGDFFYFVHSFMAMPYDNKHILAQCDYEDLTITASVKKDNITGCQFHPEKSAESGLEIINHFLTS